MVCDPVDDSVLFTNDKMNECYDVDNPIGKQCWDVFQRESARCSYCPITQLENEPDVPVVWEHYDERADRWYLNRDSIIPWTDGRMVHLQQGVDVTDSHRIREALQVRLHQHELMSAMSSSFISDQDTETLVKNAMRTVGEFLKADRVSLRRYGSDGLPAKFEATWVSDEAYAYPATPAPSPMQAMHRAFAEQGQSYISCDNAADDPLYAPMVTRGTISFVAVPLIVDNEHWGILCLEMCSRQRGTDQNEIDTARMVGNLIGGVLLRERTQDKLRDAMARAEESSRAKSNFLANMSHEIRTPMNAIIGMTELARASGEPGRMLYCLDKVDDASRHLLGIINDILDMSKIDAGHMELSAIDFPLEKMLRRVSTVTAFRAEQKRQEYLIRVEPDVPVSIVADNQRLAQVLTNLLSNAIKFAPEGGRVQLTVRSSPLPDNACSLTFEVEDNGIGISAENQAKLFQSFQQADNTISRRFGGTGLGLVISQNIVKQMGGEIQVESEVGKGSRFWFTIQIPVGKSVFSGRLSEGVDWNRVRMLAVDDDPDLLEYVQTITKRAGISCMVATGGAEALTALEKGPPCQLMLTDWRMPGMDGLELTRRVREKYGQQITIVLATAAESNEIETEARSAGVDEILAKPLLPSLLFDCLNKHLSAENALQNTAEPAKELDFRSEGTTDGIFVGQRVLVAEDVEINWEILAAMLADTGIELENAGDGLQAVDMVRSDPGRYQLVLMDIHMPNMDGYEATKTIRRLEDERARKLPIVAMTANVFKEDVERCLACGMNDHMGKPIDFEELVSKLHVFLR
ncbi:response regulator [Ruminococcaceae bacterium OttesenSCG-928-D13]|nr:response regulator [Ruminococcaceae bacterium OttesenSCG-928-D13]